MRESRRKRVEHLQNKRPGKHQQRFMQLNTLRSVQRSYDLDSLTNKDTSAIHVTLMS